MKDILVAYFSHKGQNYFSGEIVDLKVGNTAVVAETVSKLTGGDLFEIKPVEPYPFDYMSCTKLAAEEKKRNARPEFEGEADLSLYTKIVLCYPNWWGTMPMCVWSFLEKYNFRGKSIYPLCTHEGSGMGQSEQDVKRLSLGAEVANGLAIFGSKVTEAEERIKNWLYKNKLV